MFHVTFMTILLSVIVVSRLYKFALALYFKVESRPKFPLHILKLWDELFPV